MDILFITLILIIAIAAIFLLGWIAATVVLCIHAKLTGGDVRQVFNNMMEEW